jgi:acyl-CoA thioesterase
MAALLFLWLIAPLPLPAITLSVALDTSINFTKPVVPGDILTAEAKELHNGRSTGLYHITITNQNDEQVAFFKGICYRTGKNLI